MSKRKKKKHEGTVATLPIRFPTLSSFNPILSSSQREIASASCRGIKAPDNARDFFVPGGTRFVLDCAYNNQCGEQRGRRHLSGKMPRGRQSACNSYTYVGDVYGLRVDSTTESFCMESGRIPRRSSPPMGRRVEREKQARANVRGERPCIGDSVHSTWD